MSYLDLVDRVTLFRALRTIDIEIAASVRAGHCPHCGGPLHVADYERKPRGERIKIPEECRIRCGLCCGWCRQRAEVPSCLFLGRRVYWGCVVLLVTAAAQGAAPSRVAKLCERTGATAVTVRRWVRYFDAVFPFSDIWRRVRGFVRADVRDDDLPGGLLHGGGVVDGGPKSRNALVMCLRLLARPEPGLWSPAR